MKLALLLSLLALPLMAAERKLGWLPSPHGVRAAPIASHPQFRAAPLPPAASIKQWFTTPTNQKDIGSCGPTSVREVYSASYQKKYPGKDKVLSALDIYQRTLIKQGNFPEDVGVYNSTMLLVILDGSLTEKTWPYKTEKLGTLPNPTKTKALERSRNQVLKGYTIPTDDNGYSQRQCIANLKIAPIVGTLWYGNSGDARLVDCQGTGADGTRAAGVVINLKRWVIPYPSGRQVGGHDVPVISYDMNMKFPTGEVGGVEIKNHWVMDDGRNTPWGDAAGCAWAPAAWFFSPRFTDDILALEAIDR